MNDSTRTKRPQLPEIPEGGLTLVCTTNDEGGDCRLASLSGVDQAWATSLLKFRDAFKAAKKAVDAAIDKAYRANFYTFALWDYSPDFYANVVWKVDGGEDEMEAEVPEGEWLTLLDGYAMRETGQGDLMQLTVKEDGVMWYAYHKHGGPQFETQKLSWADLRTVARGRNPFAPLKDEVNHEAQDDADEG